MAKEKYVLTAEEQIKVLEAWNSLKMTSLKDIIVHTFGREIDARYAEGKAVKEFLVSRNLKAVAAHEHVPKTDSMSLTLAQKEFIANQAANYSKVVLLARDVWQNQDITPLYTEYKLVKDYHDGLDVKLRCQEGNTEVKKYSPPKTEEQAIARINRYAQTSLEVGKMNQKEKECIKRLIKYCHTFRFISEMETLSGEKSWGSISERDFLESQFIKWVWDKVDLSEEDVDQYITLGLNMLETKKIGRELEELRRLRDDQMDNNNGQINMALNDHINELGKRKDAKEKQQEAMMKTLTGNRAERLERNGTASASIAAMYEIWKDKEKREKIAKLALMRKEKILEEMKNLATMDALKFEMFGLDDIEGTF